MSILRNALAALALLLCALPVSAGELDRAAAVLAGSEAKFTQTFRPKGFARPQTERGSVLFGALPRMRWEYEVPERKVFIFDGNRSWFYVPADKQVTIATLDDARRADMPFLVIGDAESRNRNFTVREQTRGNVSTVSLEPLQQSAPIRHIRVTIDAVSHGIQRVEYTDREGNQTAFAFSGMHPRSAGPDSFRFDPPAGVQVVNQ
jgi:outer membrane lipoprotein carrier protein